MLISMPQVSSSNFGVVQAMGNSLSLESWLKANIGPAIYLTNTFYMSRLLVHSPKNAIVTSSFFVNIRFY